MLIGDVQAAAGDQGGIDASVSQVRTQGRDSGEVKWFWAFLDFEPTGYICRVVHQVTMANSYAFGGAGGAGRVDHVSQIFRSVH